MTVRESYHHGALRGALVEAAVAAARAGGEPAVRLNQLASGLGVSASAAYRHFPQGLAELLVAVGDVGRAELADGIAARLAQVPGGGDPVALARARFRASGQAYVAYATEQPGLFQVACRHDVPPAPRPDGPPADPLGLLEACLDDLVAVGALPLERRPWASVAAWSAVHGLSLLLTEGSLRRLPAPEQHAAVERTLDMVARGI